MNASNFTFGELSRRTKIVCTIGPASNTPKTLRQLVVAGMDVARLNFAHGTHQQHSTVIRHIRSISRELGRPIAILQDLPGPKARTGKLKEASVDLEENTEFVLTTRDIEGDEHQVSVSFSCLPGDVRAGNTIFLGDGAIQLQVVESTREDIRCNVIKGGTLQPQRGVNIPEVRLSTPSVTAADLTHLRFGLEQGVDIIALSFVRQPEDITKIKELVIKNNSQSMVIAKIEKYEAMENIDSILDTADGAMIARGDLGVEIPIERVPLAQKEIIQKCKHLGKPVIVATQMLESMVSSIRPLRAEVTDVANAIFDGTDAVMLSGETAMGRYPVETVKMMTRISIAIEPSLPYSRILREMGLDLEPTAEDAMSYNACHTAQQLDAAAIIAFTSSGSTAQRVARYRPRAPILAITTNENTRQNLMLTWGVYPYLAPEERNLDKLLVSGVKIAIETGIASKGDLVVMVAGVPMMVPGTTNMVRVVRID